MKYRRVVTTADDRVVRDTARAFLAHVGFDQRFDLKLVHSGFHFLHREHMGLSGDVGSTLHHTDFFFILMQTHLAENDSRIDDRMRRIRSLQTTYTLRREVAE